VFDVEVSWDVMDYAGELTRNAPFGRGRTTDGTQEQQFVGMVGQTIVHDLLGVAWPSIQGGPDGGVDCVFHGLSVDVKTMGRETPVRDRFSNNYSARQARYPTDVLVFCSYNWMTQGVTVCGWLTKQEFLQKATLHQGGTCARRSDGSSFTWNEDTYTVKNWRLRHPTSAAELREQLAALASIRASTASAVPFRLCRAA
jgi:hypothetical protein